MLYKLNKDKTISKASRLDDMQDFDDRLVKQTIVNSKLVSTMFLAIDHGWGGSPKLFETMVFPVNYSGEVTNWSELYCERYGTWNEAIDGHAKAVELCENYLL